MSAVNELLDRLTEIGAIITPAGDGLILRAGARPVPAELVKRLRQAKPEVLAALSLATPRPEPSHLEKMSDTAEGQRWRDRLAARITDWFHGDRGWEEARRLAWGDLENEWHERYCHRCPAWQCAGCRQPISGFEALNLPDGNRVHFDPIDCLLSFGRRWRGEARAALVAFGLEPPDVGGNPL